MSVEEAMVTVKKNRDVHPNTGFLAKLVELDEQLQGNKSMWFVCLCVEDPYLYSSFHNLVNFIFSNKQKEQAWAELCQAQFKLG